MTKEELEIEKYKQDADVKKAIPKEWLRNERSHRQYLNGKRFLELILALAFCVLLFICAWHHLIEGETVAAILGVMAGYFFEHWREKGKQI